jgi:hypothetical protein
MEEARRAILVPHVRREEVRNLSAGVPYPVELRFPDGTSERSPVWLAPFTVPELALDVQVTLERGVLAGTEVFIASDAAVEAGDGAAEDGALRPDAPVPCGGNACAPSQYCVQPCMGGTAICLFVEDGGACPPGTVQYPYCVPPGGVDAGGRNCAALPSPMTFFCVDDLAQAQAGGCNGASVISPGQIGCACPL